MHRIVFATVFFPGLCIAQAPPTHLVVGGGLLGKFDGFCEVDPDALPTDACPPGRAPLGGLYGLQETLKSVRGADANAYLLLTGNNLPKDFNANLPGYGPFVQAFASLGADVAALGQDDLLRAVFPARIDLPALKQPVPPPSRYSPAVRKFLQNNAYRFLASNAAIRTSRSHLNKTWSNGYELMVPRDQSLPWTTAKLSFDVPDVRQKTATVSLQAGAQVIVSNVCVDLSAGSGSIKVSLTPATTYTFTIADGKNPVQFTFKVDAALTPWNSNPPGLSGLPVAWLAHPNASPVLVASLIDPAVLDVLDPSRWKESDDEGESLVLYPPADAAKYLLIASRPTGAIPVLLADLNDALAAQVASSSSAWRLVTFNADSHLLGCQAGVTGCTKGRGGDYESGDFSELDRGPLRTRIWGRPEWIAETLLNITATPSGSGWTNVSVDTITVAGGRATSQPGRSVDVLGQSYPPPPGPSIMFSRPTDQTKRVWWRSRADMAVVLMDSMRQRLVTDLAIADARIIDKEVIAELSDMADTIRPNTNPPQRMITDIGSTQLLEILWRHDPYTVIKITGKDLVTVLGKFAKLPADEDDGGVCVRGLSGPQFSQPCSLPDTIKTNLLEINDRYFNPGLYYSVALPQSLARAAGLAYPRKQMVNVFDTVLNYVAGFTPAVLNRISPDEPLAAGPCKTQPPAQPSPQKSGQGAGGQSAIPSSAAALLPPAPAPAAAPNSPAQPPPQMTWPNLLGKKLLSIFFVPPASFELGGQNYSVPLHNGKADTSGFSAIPGVGEKAQHLQKFNMTGEIHAAPIDLPAISLDFVSRVNLNRLETFPNTSTGFKQYSYTPDQWTVGGAFRSKVLTDALTKAAMAAIRPIVPSGKRPELLRLQPFAGYFDDTSVYHYNATWTRTADKAPFQENDAKPNYAYLGAGVEISPVQLGKYFSVNNTRLEQDWGMNYAAPTGVIIGGQGYTMEDVRRCGVQSLLDGGSGCTAAPTDGPREVRYTYETHRQSRRQFLTTLAFAFGPDNKKESFSLDIKANHWGEGPNGYNALDPVHTAEFIFKSSFPVGAGITFGPYYRYLTVTAFKSDSNFISRRYGFTLTIPLTGKNGHGRFFF